MKAYIGGAWREIVAAQAYISGSWRPLRSGKAYIDAAWRDVLAFADALSLTAPASFAATGSTTSITSSTITATPAGGLSPLTYAWTTVSGGPVTINSPTSAASTFTATDGVSVTVRCTVTDSLGSTASADVAGTFTYSEPPSGGGGGGGGGGSGGDFLQHF